MISVILCPAAKWHSLNVTSLRTIVQLLTLALLLCACGGPELSTGGPGQAPADPMVTRDGASLTSIQVVPGDQSLPVGLLYQYRALGTYSDGYVEDLTNVVAWSSTNAGVATLSNLAGTRGRLRCQGPGTATVRARLNGLLGTASLTVSSARAIFIRVESGPSDPLPVGLTRQFLAIGVYDDGSEHDVTLTANWGSSNTTLATVSNQANKGLATALSPGALQVRARLDSLLGAAPLQVVRAVLVSIQVSPTEPTLPDGVVRPFTATGHYSDGSTVDLTSSSIWTSSLPGKVRVSNTRPTKGLVTARSPGQSTIRASVGSINGSTLVTVTSELAMELISVSSSGQQQNASSPSGYPPALSHDGQKVAFSSNATNLAAVSPGTTNVFLRDRQAGTTILVSQDTDGTPGDNNSWDVTISGDGDRVVFQSWARFAENATSFDRDVYVRDLSSGTTRLVARLHDGVPFDSPSWNAVISADGSTVALNGAPHWNGPFNHYDDLFFRLLDVPATLVLLNPALQEPLGLPFVESLSSDGQIVALTYRDNDLVLIPAPNIQHVYTHDNRTGIFTLIDVGPTGLAGNDWSGNDAVSLSGDGRYVAFQSASDNLVVPDSNGRRGDVFLRDTQTNTTRLVNTTIQGLQADLGGSEPRISADGRYVVFTSNATNLHGPAGFSRVFVKDMLTGRCVAVSRPASGTGWPDGDSSECSISGDGTTIGFASIASNLVPGDGNGAEDLFVVTNPLYGD
jgi:hypothetical protein